MKVPYVIVKEPFRFQWEGSFYDLPPGKHRAADVLPGGEPANGAPETGYMAVAVHLAGRWFTKVALVYEEPTVAASEPEPTPAAVVPVVPPKGPDAPPADEPPPAPVEGEVAANTSEPPTANEPPATENTPS